MKEKLKRYISLFLTMLTISSTANSGYAILSVMKSTFVKKKRWLTEDEMEDYVALIQSAPGPLAINASAIVGYHIAGPGGALAAVTGCAIPPLAIMLLVSVFYGAVVGNSWVRVFLKGMQAGVIAMLLDLIYDMFRKVTEKKKVYPILIMAAAFLYARFLKASVLYLVLGCIFAGVASYLAGKKGVKRE